MTNTPTLTIETAQALLNDPEYVAAYAEWNRRPMDIADEAFRKAMDWAEAALFVASHHL